MTMESVPMECCKLIEVKPEPITPKKRTTKARKEGSIRANAKTEVTNETPPKFRGLHRKWRKRSKRPNQLLGNGSKDSPPAHCLLFGCEVQYRVCGTIVMFKTDQILALTKTALGLRTDVGTSTPVGAILRHLRIASKYELLLQDQDQSWVRTHISWKAYRDLVNEAVYDIALKEMLKKYVPFESTQKQESSLEEQGNTPTLEQDSLKITDITVPFVVHKGRIFLDLLASFTILGQLRLAFMNRWERVDEILEQQGLNHKDAFRRNHKCRTKERRWTSQRSHITFRAIKVLAANGLVEDSSRKRTLEQLFNHLDSEINRITNMKKTLLDTIEEKVLALLRDFGHPSRKVEEPVDEVQEELVGTELCASGCGRQYHFTLRCCLISHQICLSGKPVGFIVQQGRIFLEKCGAFAALGRMYVIRCSDYRKSDKALSSSGLKPKKHYLYERHISPDQNTHSKRRNRRTHISFEAFKVLVNSGFSEMAKNKELAEAMEQIQVEVLLSQCVKFVPEKVNSPGKQDSSSGVESGSSNSGSGTNSPILFSDNYPSEVQELAEKENSKVVDDKTLQKHDLKDFTKIKVLGQSINVFKRGSMTYLSAADVCQCLVSSERSLPRMRRLARDLVLSQGPPFKKFHGQIYVSLECLRKFLESQKITPIDVEFSDSLKALFTGQRKFNSFSPSSESGETEKNMKKKFSELKSVGNGHLVTIKDIDIPVRVEKDLVYLEKKSVFKLLNIQTPAHVAFRAIDKALEAQNLSIDSSFLYDGRCRSYISTQALRVLYSDNLGDIESILCNLEKRAETLKINRNLKLTSFNNIPIKVVENSVYLCTINFMSAAGFSKSSVLNYTSKSFATLVRLLKRRGLNTSSCFLKWGKSKYANLSVFAAMTLMKTEFGPFRDRKRMNRLKGEILSSLKENGINYDECVAAEDMAKKCVQVQVKEEAGAEENDGQLKLANLGHLFPPIRYQVKDGIVFLHRKTSFEAIGAETSLLSNVRGFATINNILLSNRLNIRDCFIRGNQEQYAFISIQALIILLECDDPAFATADNKDPFYHGLFHWISEKIKDILSPFSTFPLEGLSVASVPYLIFKDRLFLHLRTSFAFSGLYEKRSWEHGDNEIVLSEMDDVRIDAIVKSRELELHKLEYLPDGDDARGFIPVDALMVLTKVDGGTERATDYHRLIWKDMIQAILHEEPKLRVQVKIVEFRESLLSSLLRLLVAGLSTEHANSEDQDFKPTLPFLAGQCGLSLGKQLRDPKIEQVIQSDMPETPDFCTSFDEHQSPHDDDMSKELFTISRSDFDNAVDHARKSLSYGDWHVKFCSESEIRFFVNPGFGASKKPSFLQPDMWAILSYELRLRPEMTPDFFINGHRVPDDKFRHIFSKSITKGMFNLLYSLLILRPCFGAFNPELVETFQKKEEGQFQDLMLDTHFIGSSQSGRTYAGCVRSRSCSVLAQSRISDTCGDCEKLAKIVINRSVLTTPDHVNSKNSQLSVWKVEESSVDGCIFLCPQLQSFNTSLPHQFQSDNQATSIVSHRVYISNDLQIRISLNDTSITAKTYPGDFANNKQVGPLLDWVASLRLCIGYPDPVLVEKSRFIAFKKHLISPETRKYFDYITVDENFEWKKQNSSLSCHGTLRTQSCRFVAEDFADVCSQCRLLQQTLDCLAIK